LRSNEKKTDYFISEQEFQDKLDSGKIPNYLWGQVADYRVGYDPKEFSKAQVVLINVDDKKARKLKAEFESKGGETLTIFVHASEQQRIQRYRVRGSLLFEDEARYRMETDVVDPNPENHSDFDLVVENKEGDFENTMNIIMEKVNKFLEK
jgi:guanylate kinase